MTNNNQPISILDKYLGEQAKYADSPYRKFTESFSLTFILKKLDKDKRKEFIGLLEKEKFVEVLEFLDSTLPDLADELPKALKEELEKIKNKINYDDRKEHNNDDRGK